MTDEREQPGFLPSVAAEAFGTFVVVAVIVGATVLAGTVVGSLGIALATGFAIAGVYATIAHVSGAHLNPAVTVGLAISGRFPWRDVPTHVAAQLIGATLGAALVLGITADGVSATLATAQREGFAAGGYGAELSPDGFGLLAVALVEAVFTAVIVALYIARGPADAVDGGHRAAAGLTIGLAVAALTIVAAPVSNASFNPARALATALFAGPDRIAQVWAFILFPLLGAVVAGTVARVASRRAGDTSDGSGGGDDLHTLDD
ncbi:aquaporin Z [Labedella gwakjiensis]|uniref:Aquaporin Z n=1 Tax=Labedella gwakjiensis TaxID=390269 RepID=A0A2P8GXZ8_9MICO|nr:aquaporin [Labedella gwakjiensis]PSL38815.1 aquaporin Z [Labedella gwakjiensis]RUQ86714.1 aquaporin Z [Labedella gwakjiensis]